MSRQRKSQSGFTIIEILLAMAIFSFVMITIITAFSQIIRSYRKGVVSQRTQEATRQVVDLVSKEARVSTEISVGVYGTGVNKVNILCFKNGSQFEYKANNHTLKQGSSSPSCNSLDPLARNVVDKKELDVLKFKPSIKSTSGTPPVTLGINLEVSVGTNNGPDSLMNAAKTACDPLKAGSQFCSISSLKTSIGLRVKESGP